jgi:chromosomal replication initiator protein
MITLRRPEFGAFSALTDEGWMPTPADPQPPPKLALNGFQVLDENRSAVRAAKSLARAVLLGKRAPVCPLIVHGPPGCGKTRLTAAVLSAITAASPEVTARSESAGDLARLELAGEEAVFADRDLRTCDLLVLEDIQHLPDRAAEAVCGLIDHRVHRRKALLVTANAGPAALAHLPQRLTSRLSAGLVVPMEPPGSRGRRLILAKAADAKNLRLTPEALDWLAAQPGGLRTTLGSLQNLALVARQFPGPLDQPSVEQILAGSGQPTSGPGRLDAIIGRVAAAFGVAEKELLGPSRLRNVLLSRQVAMYLARELAGFSLPRIGAAFGRDHTTVLHACRKIEAELESDAVLSARVRQLRSGLA